MLQIPSKENKDEGRIKTTMEGETEASRKRRLRKGWRRSEREKSEKREGISTCDFGAGSIRDENKQKTKSGREGLASGGDRGWLMMTPFPKGQFKNPPVRR